MVTNLAIKTTCLLKEAEEEGVKLSLQSDCKLKVTIPVPSPDDLLVRLKDHKDLIMEQLKYNKANSCPFAAFFDEYCLFYPGEGFGTPEVELLAIYHKWTKQNKGLYMPTKLKKRLCEMGCVRTKFAGNYWWLHVVIWGEIT